MTADPSTGIEPGLLDPNLACLDAALRLLRLQLEQLGCPQAERSAEMRETQSLLGKLRAEVENSGCRFHLDRLAAGFRLTDLERQLLLLAAAPDLEHGFGAVISQLQTTGGSWPTVGLAWRLFCPTLKACVESRDSLREDAPLFRYRLLEMGNAEAPMPDRFLRVDRRITDVLVGSLLPDARVAPRLRYAPARGWQGVAAPEAASLATRIRDSLAPGSGAMPQLVVNLFGGTSADQESFAAEACNAAGISLLGVTAEDLPARDATVFVRESVILSCALFVDGLDSSERGWIRSLAEGGPVLFIGTQQPVPCPPEMRGRIWLPMAVSRPDARQRMELWEQTLRPAGVDLNGSLELLAGNFDFNAEEIRQAARQAAHLAWLHGEKPGLETLTATCRAEVRHRMKEVAQQLNPVATWKDLLLPEEVLTKLHELCAQVRCQQTVMDHCGFRRRLSRGRGITALFVGPSGTGKTMASEVIAHDLGRDLYRVDLARVVSKYIGETEKNLRVTFAEAERARCVVLFDEADALFGRRTEVRDSHDRYANIEVSYLLQLMEETEHAVVILASNRREAIDDAFLRRFRFLMEFPLPGAALRRQLWSASFPPEVDLRGVRFDALADKVPLSGASIKNIALAATYLGAADGGSVGVRQVAHAARRELERLGRPAPFRDEDLASADAPNEVHP